jgi:hypothetical protein
MKIPCEDCIVSSCCSERCKDYAIYVYETKDYEHAGKAVKRQIENMDYDEAVDHILKVENMALYLDKL